MIVTIDGYAGSGKSTAARMLAATVGFDLMNTGAMYRAVAFALGRLGVDIYAEPRDESTIRRAVDGFAFHLTDTRVWLNHEDVTDYVYSEEMGRGASRVGTFPEVRKRLQREQRRIADQRDIICEGRDQGTAVFPDAPVKFFFTASAAVRAARRAAQEGLDPVADPTRFAALVSLIESRDQQDEGRAIDPLRQAVDAVVIDTSELDLDTTVSRMREVVERCRGRR